MFENKLLLQTRNDIPFEQAQLIIHNPTIKEISYIGEKTFWMGCEYLDFSKDNLKQQDKVRLEHLSNFEILMTIMKNEDTTIKQLKVCLQMVLLLMFPDYKVNFLPNSILFSRKNEQGQIEQKLLDKDNFESFRNIVSKMFCLAQVKNKNAGTKYNPKGAQAQALVNKFIEREKKLAKLKNRNKNNEINILEEYISILAVGLHKSKNDLMQYTVYQLLDEFRRFKAKQDFDIYVSAKMAGAKDIEDIKHWMSDLSSENTT